MQIVAIPKLMGREKAMEIAEKKGNLLGRAIVGKKPITLKLMYLESKEIVYGMTDLPVPLLGRLFSRKAPKEQKIRILVEGTRCNPAYVAEELQTVTMEIDDEDSVQASAYPVEKMIQDGKYLARRMVRKQAGRNVALEPETVRSIYRPYYVAFYGKMDLGTRVRYLPIPADGNEISRVF